MEELSVGKREARKLQRIVSQKYHIRTISALDGQLCFNKRRLMPNFFLSRPYLCNQDLWPLRTDRALSFSG
ncbi:hypothetical protein F2P79_009163 [Pimephales promelas]|nr:hypothetical protein F2P79_009163 [Pimephales promelas]